MCENILMHWKYRRDLPPKDYLFCFYSNSASSFFSTFTHVCRYIVIISILSIFHSGSFFSFMLCLFLCCFLLFLSMLICTSFLIFIPFVTNFLYTNLYSKNDFDHANHEVHSIKSNKSLVILIKEYRIIF